MAKRRWTDLGKPRFILGWTIQEQEAPNGDRRWKIWTPTNTQMVLTDDQVIDMAEVACELADDIEEPEEATG